jgi:anti-anti-sigma factor
MHARNWSGGLLEISSRKRKGIIILDLKGNLTSGGGEVEFAQVVERSLDSGSMNILVNLREVTLVDSTGIGRLLAARTMVTNRGGKLKLLHLPPVVHDVLQITQILAFFDIQDDEEAALASFE